MFDPHTLTILSLGFVLGLRHALDADHLAALSTVLAERPTVQASTAIGFFWGLGHTLMLLCVGTLLLTLNLTISESVANMFEFAVGGMLVALGLSLARRMYREQWHLHTHEHDGQPHVHLHSHHVQADHRHGHWYQGSLRPLGIGMAHGLAGSAALMLVVLSTVTGIGQGIGYIVVFGIGSILGMVGVGVVLSLPVMYSLTVGPRAYWMVQGLACLVSIGLGVLMMVRIGLGGGWS
ncbi:MAG: Nickel transporter UreH [Nitrospira sp.]|nr:MAG: Nickel transporter UreH [Nitrospira sp.]